MKLPIVLLMCVSVVVGQTITYDYSSQPKCTVVKRGPTSDCRWKTGMDMVDQVIEGGRIIAYKIKWFSGTWMSTWYVPGVNDLDEKYNPSAVSCAVPGKANTLRKRWSNFYDHEHEFIICKPN